MKANDYFRLGKISIKARKKSTRNTVRGIAFGLILLVPIIFFTLGFFIDVKNQLDGAKTISSFNVTSKNMRMYDDDEIGVNSSDYFLRKQGRLSYKTAKNFAGNSAVEEYIVRDEYFLPKLFYYNYGATDIQKPGTGINSEGYYYSLNGGAYEMLQITDRSDNVPKFYDLVNDKITAFNLKESNNKYITDAEISDLKGKKPILYGNGFSNDSRREIMISQRMTKKLKLDETTLVGKTLSIEGRNLTTQNSNGIKYDNDTDSNNQYVNSSNEKATYNAKLITNFKIVGIISDDVYKLASRENEGDFWITTDSVYYTNEMGSEESFAPIMKKTKVVSEWDPSTEYEVLIATYKSMDFYSLSQQASEAGVIFPFLAGINYSGNGAYAQPLMAITTTLMQCSNYSKAKNLQAIIAGKLGEIVVEDLRFTNRIYDDFTLLNTIGTYVSLIMFVFGGIIFFVTLLNLFNTINYSVQARTNYIGVMRAIGAKQKEIPKLYFVEIVLIFLRASISTIIISCAMCVGIKIGIDSIFKNVEFLKISLNLLYYPLTLVCIMVFVFFIAFLFSRLCCFGVSNKHILDVLKDDK